MRNLQSRAEPQVVCGGLRRKRVGRAALCMLTSGMAPPAMHVQCVLRRLRTGTKRAPNLFFLALRQPRHSPRAPRLLLGLCGDLGVGRGLPAAQQRHLATHLSRCRVRLPWRRDKSSTRARGATAERMRGVGKGSRKLRRLADARAAWRVWRMRVAAQG